MRSAVTAVVAAACLVFASGANAQPAPAPSTGLQSLSGFIRVSNTNFVDDNCTNFVFSGYNTWQPIEQASGLIGGMPALEEQLDAAVENNFTVIRAFAFVVQEGYNMQLSDGTYNESLLVAMDEFVAASSTRGLKLIMALANNWNYNSNMSDTKTWYSEQAGAESIDDFWVDPDAIQMYKDHARYILQRKNTVTGVTYGNDPTFFAWNLINEGRCETTNCTAADIQNWIGSVAPYVRGLTNSLVTVGEEGYYQASNCHANLVNPVPNSQEWCLETGQDFLPNHFLAAIDYTSIHMWSDNWGRTDVPFAQGWLEAHMQDAQRINKPLVLEEFGKASGPFSTSGNTYGNGSSPTNQYDYYKLVYSIVESSIDTGSNIRGVAFWRWDAINTGDLATLSSLDAALTLNSTSQAFTDVVVPFSQRLHEISLGAERVPGCTNVNSASSVGSPVGGQGNTPVTTTPSAVAGRKLLQATAPAPAVNIANINAMVTNCTAFYPYSLQAQTGAPAPSR